MGDAFGRVVVDAGRSVRTGEAVSADLCIDLYIDVGRAFPLVAPGLSISYLDPQVMHHSQPLPAMMNYYQ